MKRLFLFNLFLGLLAGLSQPAQSAEFRLVCDRETPSIAGALSCSDLRSYFRGELKQYINSFISGYYRGFEPAGPWGGKKPVTVPICNFAAGECSHYEWANSVRNCDFPGSDSCNLGPSVTEKSLRNYNRLMDQERLPQQMRYGGTYCSFSVDCGMFGCSVRSNNTCAREYAWYRGLYPQAIWKAGEELTSELSSGMSVTLISNSSGQAVCGALVADLERAQAQVDAADTALATKQAQLLAQNPNHIVENCAIDPSVAADPDPESKDGQALLQSGFSFGVCKVVQARILLYKAMSQLVKCEAVTRGTVKWQEFESVFADHVRAVQERTERNCRTSNNAKLNACYRREVNLMAHERLVQDPQWRTTEPIGSPGADGTWSGPRLTATLRRKPAALEQKIKKQLDDAFRDIGRPRAGAQ